MPTRPGLKIGRILGIPIYLHASWVIIFFLITLSLAMQFTQEHPRWSATQHWTVGIVTSLLFFASVLFHELAHSVWLSTTRFKLSPSPCLSSAQSRALA